VWFIIALVEHVVTIGSKLLATLILNFTLLISIARRL